MFYFSFWYIKIRITVNISDNIQYKYLVYKQFVILNKNYVSHKVKYVSVIVISYLVDFWSTSFLSENIVSLSVRPSVCPTVMFNVIIIIISKVK